jgi:hypothetical protein
MEGLHQHAAPWGEQPWQHREQLLEGAIPEQGEIGHHTIEVLQQAAGGDLLIGERLEAGSARGTVGGDGGELGHRIDAEHLDAVQGAEMGQPTFAAAQIQQGARGRAGDRLKDRFVGDPFTAEDLAAAHGEGPGRRVADPGGQDLLLRSRQGWILNGLLVIGGVKGKEHGDELGGPGWEPTEESS